MRHTALMQGPIQQKGFGTVARGASVPPPTGGWDAISPLASMPPDRAIVLDNWFPQPGYVELKKGFVTHSDTGTGVPIESVMAYNAANVLDDKLFAANDDTIFDVTDASEGLNGNDAFTKVLLHLDGADASTTITDVNAGGSPHVWTANGNAQIDTAQFKFGGASGLFDGTGDFLSTPDSADFALGAGDWTIDCWFNCTATGGTDEELAGQYDAGGAIPPSAFIVDRDTGNRMRILVAVGGALTGATGTTQFTNLLNPGWHHYAAVRDGNTLRVFLDGVQENTGVISGSVNDSALPLSVGRRGDQVANTWTGWIDEFRLSVGVARWTANFTPPTRAYGNIPVVTGALNGRWQHVNFTTTGGHFLYIVNGADAPRYFDGTAWATPAITGTDETAFIHINIHKNRLWFVIANSTKAAYLPVDSIQGEATEFELGGLFDLGGYLVAMGTWSVGSGDTQEDYAAFISSKGQVAIYAGTDPNNASTWAKRGVFVIGPPIGRRCFTKVGADLAIISIDGLLPISQALVIERGAAIKVALTANIQPVVSQAARDWGDNFGWQLTSYPRGTRAILNVPAVEGNTQQQYVMNTVTGAWCRFLDENANTYEVFQDRIFFGSNDGMVNEADTGGTNNGDAIEADMECAFNYYGARGNQKRWTMCRPLITTDGAIQPGLGFNVDFRRDAPIEVPNTVVTLSAIWDEALWDLAVWPEDSRVEADWQGVSGIGYCASIRMKVNVASMSAAAPILQVNGFDVLLEDGAFV